MRPARGTPCTVRASWKARSGASRVCAQSKEAKGGRCDIFHCIGRCRFPCSTGVERLIAAPARSVQARPPASAIEWCPRWPISADRYEHHAEARRDRYNNDRSGTHDHHTDVHFDVRRVVDVDDVTTFIDIHDIFDRCDRICSDHLSRRVPVVWSSSNGRVTRCERSRDAERFS